MDFEGVIDGLAKRSDEAVGCEPRRGRDALQAAGIGPLAREIAGRESFDAESLLRRDALRAIEREEVVGLLGRRVLEAQQAVMASGAERALCRELKADRLSRIDRDRVARLRTRRRQAVRFEVIHVDRER